MKLRLKDIANQLFSFSKVKKTEPEAKTSPGLDPLELDNSIFASNVLWGTNPDLTPKTACQGESPETPAPTESKPVRQNRDFRIKISFTPEELAEVKRKAAEAGLDCSKYIRAKIRAAKVRPAPVVNVSQLIAELRRAGSYLNQILIRANEHGFIDGPELHKALEETEAVFRKIREAYLVKEEAHDE
ncbi:MAG: hypothetical protein II881_08930 [Oscillospiraceae bacterium]|nr:hypothetical protein [Oscillospiraceae bacterium]